VFPPSYLRHPKSAQHDYGRVLSSNGCMPCNRLRNWIPIEILDASMKGPKFDRSTETEPAASRENCSGSAAVDTFGAKRQFEPAGAKEAIRR